MGSAGAVLCPSRAGKDAAAVAAVKLALAQSLPKLLREATELVAADPVALADVLRLQVAVLQVGV
jgi:hypothetical protein